MGSRVTQRLLAALCLMSMFFAVPAFAITTSSVVTGTVTAAGTGAKLAGIEVSGYYRTSDGYSSIDSTLTSANGEYRLEFGSSETATFSILAADIAGTYDSVASKEATIAVGESETVDLAMNRDTRAPRVGLGYGTSTRLAVKSVVAAAKYIDDFGFFSDGADFVQVYADDSSVLLNRPMYGRYYDGSGVAEIAYAVDGGEWEVIAAAEAMYADGDEDRILWVAHQFPMPGEGVHSLSIRATDTNGNTSPVRSMLLVVDKTAPVTKYRATTKQITLTPSDSLSEVAGTFWRTGSTGMFAYGSSIPVPSKGYKFVEFYSQDEVGNTETAKKLKVSAPALLNTPKPSTESVSRTKTFTVTGSVYTRSKATGYLRIYKYDNGAYKYVTKKLFTEGSDGKYRVSLKLAKGTYRFRTAYGAYTTSWANPPVISGRSAKVTVR